MRAVKRRGVDPPPRWVLLLFMIFLGLGLTLADDIDFPDILTPGGGGSNTGGGSGSTGGDGGVGTVELYLAGGEGASFALDRSAGMKGLVITEKAFDLAAKRWGDGVPPDPISPRLRALLVADPGAAVGVTRGVEALGFQGGFELYGKLSVLAEALGLALAPAEETRLAVTVVRAGGAAASPSTSLEEWILHGDGAVAVFSHAGRLPLSALLKAALAADPGLTRLGLIQFEFDAAGALAARKTVEVRPHASPPAAFHLGPNLADPLVIRYHDAFLGTAGE